MVKIRRTNHCRIIILCYIVEIMSLSMIVEVQYYPSIENKQGNKSDVSQVMSTINHAHVCLSAVHVGQQWGGRVAYVGVGST